MFGRTFPLFSILGFKVKLDFSWVFLAILVTWSLAMGFFPSRYENYAPTVYWSMGIFGSLGLFASIIFHELSHSIVARQFGIPIRGITLFIFGGVAEMEEEPPSAVSEFLMAIAGPAASAFLALVFYQLLQVTGESAPEPLQGVFFYLMLINGLLAAFNLIPAFPLDGGRAYRAALWYWTKDMVKATRHAAAMGSLFGLLLIGLGVFAIVTGNFVGGLWWGLIGLFLRGAASSSLQDINMRQAFKGEQVKRFMNASVITVSPHLPLNLLVEDYIYAHHYDLFPVVEDGILLGCISARQLRNIPQTQWSATSVGDVYEPTSPENTVRQDDEAMKALALMRRTQNSRLLVVEGESLVGILALKDMLEWLALKLDLEGPL